jgi:hypothetical protein
MTSVLDRPDAAPTPRPRARRPRWRWLPLLALLGSCSLVQRPAVEPAVLHDRLERLVPRGIPDRDGWIDDLEAVFAALPVPPTAPNVCAVLAVAAQESGFQTDPVVANLPTIARREIDRRAERAHVPGFVVDGVLALHSSTGESYQSRLSRVRTERQLSELFDDFVARVPLGKQLFGGLNPVHTRGPMQVHVDFAREYSRTRRYPFPADDGIPAALFSRRGSLYFGTAHLLDYEAPYDRPIYRFADYNAGRYASRNAAFQRALAAAAHRPVTADGALLPGRSDAPHAGDTERALLALGPRLEASPEDVHRALEQQHEQAFERTDVYRRVFELADGGRREPLPRAVLPDIRLEGPKLSRTLTNAWYAHRVDDRYAQCIARGP